MYETILKTVNKPIKSNPPQEQYQAVPIYYLVNRYIKSTNELYNVNGKVTTFINYG